jgi:hypothetical protein
MTSCSNDGTRTACYYLKYNKSLSPRTLSARGFDSVCRIRAALEAREHARVRSHTEVVLRAVGSVSNHWSLGLLVDLSRSGARVRTSSIYSKGSEVAIEFDGTVITAEVLRCQPITIGSYDIGLRIIDVAECTESQTAGDKRSRKPQSLNAIEFGPTSAGC